MTASDDDLLQGFLAGELGAGASIDLWIRTAAGPYRFRLSEQWEDVLQDTRLELLQLLRKGSFSGRSSLKTYVWRVVNHSCIDRVRAVQRKKTVAMEDADAFTGDHDDPEDMLAARQRGRTLLEILAKSSRECRQLWQMILDGWHYRQMSVVLEIPEGTVRVRVYRCRKQAIALRGQLEDSDGL